MTIIKYRTDRYSNKIDAVEINRETDKCIQSTRAYRELWLEYERRKRAWLESNPDATPAQIEAAMGEICRELGL